MNRVLALSLFVVLAAAQIAVPAWMIAQREITLATGRLYKFRTAPVDPYDAFRGRYVALGYEETSGPADPDADLRYGATAYAVLEEGPDGFARIALVLDRPPDGGDYVQVRVRHSDGDLVHVEWPFDRYYMNETAAPVAETAYRRHSAAGARDAYTSVRVRHGMAVIEGLYVGGTPIEDFVRTL